MTELEPYSTFFKEYCGLKSKVEEKRWEAEKPAFEAFQYRYQRHSVEVDEIYAKNSPNYNVFSILGLGRFEVLLHSPFLRNLLDPKGSHGQGTLFLKSFFKDVLKIEFDDNKVSYVRVSEEFRMLSGRIDLLITYSEESTKKAIVIENKIYAKDQQNQLLRYYSYVKDYRGYEPKNITLVYISPEGHQPSKYSIDESARASVEDKSTLICASHRKDIKPWLTSAVVQSKSETLKSIINQYIKTISKL